MGWISEGALNYICEQLSFRRQRLYGVASFYAMFSLQPRPPLVVHVCDDIACRDERRRGESVGTSKRRVGRAQGELAAERQGDVASESVPGPVRAGAGRALPACGSEPRDWTLTSVNADASSRCSAMESRWADVLVPPKPRQRAATAPPPAGRDAIGLACSGASASSIRRASTPTARHGGYEALARALRHGPDAVIREVTDSRLVGRGGAAFPTGRKWEAVARAAAQPHYLVCNADESEPGTFKDRVLMEEDPFAVVEAMTIAAFATGCEQGYLYIRGEYPLATERLRDAIAQARAAGLLGDNVMGRRSGSTSSCDAARAPTSAARKLRCSTPSKAFAASRETSRRFPSSRDCSASRRSSTTSKRSSTSWTSSSTAAPRLPGRHQEIDRDEAVLRLRLRDAAGLYEVAVRHHASPTDRDGRRYRDGRPLQAVLLGGAAGVFVAPNEIDLPLTFEGARASARRSARAS